ncbi:MAG TPA: amidohydrolase family protein, partial [Lachnospiraceae bacterium]
MDILIKNGHIIDPDTKRNEVCDLLISDGKIAALGKDLQAEGAYIIDAANFCVMPGFIDLHVHLREPGFTHKETIKTGAMAAAHGGFTTIVAMPNTKPSVDCAKIVREIYDKAKEQAPIHVLQAGAITKEQAGEVLSDIEDMVKAGIPAISEDGKSVMNAHIYKEAMKIAAKNNIPILAHCEDIDMVNGGYVNEDEHTKAMGLKGISNSVEDVIVARDIMLANDAKAHLHLC